ncbi:MAG: 50S ribosomal protein L28 [bacterium]
MARRCALTGKGPSTANNVSHANNKTKRRQFANIQDKRIYIPELNRTVRVRISHDAMRTIDKLGFMGFLRKQGLQLKDVVR